MITDLAKLIRLTESNNNYFAMRYEPAHNPRIDLVIRMRDAAQCSVQTAKMMCMCSWGAYQIMGDNLIDLGLASSPALLLASPSAQDGYFYKFIAADHITLTLTDIVTDESKRKLFARLYNGPGNVDAYAARLMQVYAENSK